MPLYIKIDFRKNGRLGAWWSRDESTLFWKSESLTTEVEETRIRDVFIALADEIDPIEPKKEEEDK